MNSGEQEDLVVVSKMMINSCFYASLHFLRSRIAESIEKLCYLGVYPRTCSPVYHLIRLYQMLHTWDETWPMLLGEVLFTLLHHLRVVLMKDLKKEGRFRLLQDDGVGRF